MYMETDTKALCACIIITTLIHETIILPAATLIDAKEKYISVENICKRVSP